MYVTKRGNKFRAWERIVVDGKVKRISVTMDRDTPQARRKAAKILADKVMPVSDLTYPELVRLYIQYQQATLKMSTWTRNQATLKRLEKNFGNRKVEQMTAGFISSKLLEKTKDPSTYNEYLARIKALMRWAYQNDYISSPACYDKLRPLKEDLTDKEKVANKFLEADELKKVLDAASPYYSAVFEFLALSGLRIGELIALEDEDVGEREITIRQTYDSNNGVINTPKTSAGWRHVHIQPELAQCIRRLRQISNHNRMTSGKRPTFFVVSKYGERLSYASANQTFKELTEKTVNKRLSLHALRHTHVALMSAQGIDLEAISHRLGHSNSRITKDVYYHITSTQKAKEDAAFDAVSVLN